MPGPPTVASMSPVDAGGAQEFLEAIIASFSVLGGGMAYASGLPLPEPPRKDSRPRSSRTG